MKNKRIEESVQKYFSMLLTGGWLLLPWLSSPYYPTTGHGMFAEHESCCKSAGALVGPCPHDSVCSSSLVFTLAVSRNSGEVELIHGPSNRSPFRQEIRVVYQSDLNKFGGRTNIESSPIKPIVIQRLDTGLQ